MHQGKETVEQEEPEEFMVAQADTVSDPRTVVVHLHDTLVAY